MRIRGECPYSQEQGSQKRCRKWDPYHIPSVNVEEFLLCISQSGPLISRSRAQVACNFSIKKISKGLFLFQLLFRTSVITLCGALALNTMEMLRCIQRNKTVQAAVHAAEQDGPGPIEVNRRSKENESSESKQHDGE